MADGTIGSGSGHSYWYDGVDASELQVLEAVRRHRDAEAAMRRRARDDMDMGDTDLAALRWLIREELAERPATSAGLARSLGISTAATVKVVVRLVTGGYVERSPHPTDRRVLLLRTLPGAHDRIHRTLGRMHEQMLRLAAGMTETERTAVIAFLDALTEIIDGTVGRGRAAEPAPPRT